MRRLFYLFAWNGTVYTNAQLIDGGFFSTQYIGHYICHMIRKEMST